LEVVTGENSRRRKVWSAHQIDIEIPAGMDMRGFGAIFQERDGVLDRGMVDWTRAGLLSPEWQKAIQNVTNGRPEMNDFPFSDKATPCGWVFYPKSSGQMVKSAPEGALFGSNPQDQYTSSARQANETWTQTAYYIENGGVKEVREGVTAFRDSVIRAYQNAAVSSQSSESTLWVIHLNMLGKSIRIDLRRGIPGAPGFILGESLYPWGLWLSGVFCYLWGFRRIYSVFRGMTSEAVGQAEFGVAQTEKENKQAASRHIWGELFKKMGK
jgi:hypothetical protein